MIFLEPIDKSYGGAARAAAGRTAQEAAVHTFRGSFGHQAQGAAKNKKKAPEPLTSMATDDEVPELTPEPTPEPAPEPDTNEQLAAFIDELVTRRIDERLSQLADCFKTH